MSSPPPATIPPSQDKVLFIYFLYQSLIQDFFGNKKNGEREELLKKFYSELFYIHLFNKYVVSTSHVPGTLLVAK